MSDKDIYIDVVFALGADKSFTYLLPEHLSGRARLGQRVRVPLGRRVTTGIIVGFPSQRGGFDVRHAEDIPDEPPVVGPDLMELAKWVASYYRAPLGMVLGTAVPPGIEEGKASRPRRGVEEDTPAWGSGRRQITPNPDQVRALDCIVPAVRGGGFSPFLLHGATGSGKTEIYLRAIEAVPDGAGAVVLVPEISLTPQLIGRFRERFGSRVAVMHSGLTDSQRRSEWRRIRSGDAAVAIGARSGVFAPFDRLGLIIVDEEHDGSYKQEEGVRYNARDVAVMRAKLSGCPVILGSATPSLESYHNALSGRYGLLELPERAGGSALPEVRIVDLKEYPGMPVTPPLADAARARLERGEQALFFLNRRGYSDFLICRDCGHVPQCPSCSISLTYHKSEGTLRCHWCGEDQAPGATCSRCGGDKIRYMGGGTERLEKELAGLFGDVKTTRMDRDTVRKRGAHALLLDEVASGRSGILVGTQMVAKGHDLPSIGIVGVALADYGLHMPDFRASERVFQVVMQVAGRAGRGDVPGEVVVQTYQPEHYALTFAAAHDYRGFYEVESSFRKELGYPPFTRLVLVTVRGVKLDKVVAGAKSAKKSFDRAAEGTGVAVMGPAPAPVKRVRGKYRYNILLRSKSVTKLHRVLDAGLAALGGRDGLSACTLDVDVDPQSMA